MKQLFKIFALPIVLIFLLMLFNASVFSQEEQKLPEENQVQIQSEIPQPELKEPQTQWIWGEVISVDTATAQILVKYLDYETDSEKEITVYAESKTTYENVAALTEIKPKDTVSIDYTTSDGKNIAKNISVEKLEPLNTEAVVPSESEAPKE
jgi:hypothetical protein